MLERQCKNLETNVEQGKAKNTVGIIFALMIGYSMVYMDKTMISTAIIPIAAEYNLAANQTGLIMSLFFLGYSLMQIPGGWLADKIGAKRVLLLPLGIIAFFSFAFGAVSSFMLFLVIRFFAGVGHGGYPPSCSKAVAENFAQEQRTFVQSLMLSTYGIGGVLAFTIGANLISMNWRYGYIALGLLFVISIILVTLFVPKDLAVKKGPVQNSASFKKLLKDRNVLILFLAMLLINIVMYGNMSWLPSFLEQKFSLDITTIGYLLSANAVFQTLGTIFAGSILTKIFLGKEKGFIFSVSLISAVLVLLFVFSNHLIFSMLALILLSMVVVSGFTAIFTLPHKIMDEHSIGSAIGIVNTGGTLGGFLSPMILGQLIEIGNGSFILAFGFLSVVSIACGLTTLAVKK
ncbi:MFS transporter [Tetragenococcus halophilus]|nr:MFS transporter [Tetragenococcus halophilus]MCO8289845.1 MFS transporter [Tetragenococcus halophilus]